MSLYRSRFLIAATAAAALCAFGALPVLAAGMVNSNTGMMSTQGHMSSDSMASQPMTQNHNTKMQQEKPMQSTDASGMKTEGSMK